MLKTQLIHRALFQTARSTAAMVSFIQPLDWLFGRVGWILILAYRRILSPRKGFRCAHAAVTAGPSCSDVGLFEFRTQPMSVAMAALEGQLIKCKKSYMIIMNGKLTEVVNVDTQLPPDLAEDIVCCQL